jgi:hypothetical protein
MKVGRALTLAAVCLCASACYRQVVQTGLTPGATVVARPWTATWVFGLVEASPIDVTRECPSGIATVVTEMTVPNWLATLFTIGIYGPRNVTVTCAGRSALNGGLKEFYIANDATLDDRRTVFAAAMHLSQRTGEPVVLRF